MKDSGTSSAAKGSSITSEPFSFPQYIIGSQRIARRQSQQAHAVCSAVMPVPKDFPKTVCKQATMTMSKWKNMSGLHVGHSWTQLGKSWEVEEK